MDAPLQTEITASLTPGRTSRRKVAKAVNYSKEQEFSDEDIFEDTLKGGSSSGGGKEEGVSAPTPTRTKRSHRGKKHDNNGDNGATVISYGTVGTGGDIDLMSSGYGAVGGAVQGVTKQYAEKGYDPTLPLIRDRYQFAAEYEEDGSPKIECIVGRRAMQDKSKLLTHHDNTEGEADEKAKKRPAPEIPTSRKYVDYEYLVKYKGLSYLHLEWKTASDLESMNKSAKFLYRRFVRKLDSGIAGEETTTLEDPTFDSSFAIPQKIIDEKEVEVLVELTDKELITWEKQRERERREEELELEQEEAAEKEANVGISNSQADVLPPLSISEQAASTIDAPDAKPSQEDQAQLREDDSKSTEDRNQPVKQEDATQSTAEDEIKQTESLANQPNEQVKSSASLIPFSPSDTIEVKIEKLRVALNKDAPYYPFHPGCDNSYRDGYVTQLPKKPRASYLFFQCSHRAEYQKRYAGASVGEIMTILGDTWRTMTEEEQTPYLTLAREEVEQFERERQLYEKAQRPNEIWQPLRRCAQVCDRLWDDGFSVIFRAAVDTEMFPDYSDYIDSPMDLGTVKTKLKNKKYQTPEVFARDLRKVWQNCKVYNQHGSAIWHVADYMSKQFERLYHAWVLAFRERQLRWYNPKARPWELTCRKHDGSCGSKDDDMVLCDFCDAMYGLKCVGLTRVPEGIWHCEVCEADSKAGNGRMFSALAEQAARRRAELGDIPKKTQRKKKYLVKWAGLGYEHCTWETSSDINDDDLIKEYRFLNSKVPEEPDVTEKDLVTVLQKMEWPAEDKKITSSSDKKATIAKQNDPASELKDALYAQIRAYSFLKFGKNTPPNLLKQCGAFCNTQVSSTEQHPHPVVECISDLVQRVAFSKSIPQFSPFITTPCLTGEYEAIIPITDKGLMMNVGEVNHSVAFLGYRQFPDGTQGPAEKKQIVHAVGDKIVAVDGISTVGKSFKDVIQVLREAGKNKFAYMRFWSSRYSVCRSEFTSMGDIGGHLHEDLRRKFQRDRRVIIQRRKLLIAEEEEIPVDNESGNEDDEEAEVMEDEEEDEEELESDYDADDLVMEQRIKMEIEKRNAQDLELLNAVAIANGRNPDPVSSQNMNVAAPTPPSSEIALNIATPAPVSSQNTTNVAVPIPVSSENVMNVATPAPTSSENEANVAIPAPVSSENVTTTSVSSATNVIVHDSTSSNNVRNAAVPASVSSDNVTNVSSENENTDSTNNSDKLATVSTPIPEPALSDVKKEPATIKVSISSAPHTAIALEPRKLKENTRSMCLRLMDVDVGYSSDEGGYDDEAHFLDGVDPTFSTKTEAYHSSSEKFLSNTVHIKKNEFSILGDRTKLFVASLLSTTEPDVEDYDNYPAPSTKATAAAAAEVKAQNELKAAKNVTTIMDIPDPNKKSSTKIEQLSSTTGEIIRVWATVNNAAATLQIPLATINSVLNGDYNEDVGDEVGGFRWRYASADAKVTASDKMTGRDIKKGRQAYLEFREKLYSHEEPLVYKGGHKLRDYQVDGVNWLASCWYKRHSCILADEMGLGKTVQIVCYIEHLFRVEKIHRPFLVVVPLSTVEHWRREFEGWTDIICCVYHDRQREWRDVMREYEWYYSDRPHTADYLKFDVLVTTYDTLIGDFDVISQIPWRVTVVDEAHRLRNIKGKLLDCMKQISAKGTLHYGFQSRVLMTGTPLQNNIQELWTLLNFIEPYKFPCLEDFESSFGNMANREQVEALQRKISPFMLRRVKEDVAKDIPSKEETLIDVELTSIQKQYYRAVFEHNHAFLSMGATRGTVPKLMNIQMELRKCCNHPFLLDGVEQREMEKYYKELSESGELADKTPEMQQMILNEHGYIKSSGKMVLLDKLLPKLRQEDHKVLIFSQMVRMLDLISEYCDFKGFRHERLDGRVRGNERQKAIDRFETEADSFVFLLSTRAGGVGINLTAADICIIFDSDWNPQNDVQAQARCHRIGQTKDVMIYRLVTSRTFEQEMFDRASKKLGLEQAVLGTFGQDNEDDKPTNKEMEHLLKKGAYALLEDDDDEQGKQFCEDDIESILAKRTRTRVVEGAKTASWLNKHGMNVTKSKFTGDSAAATADVNVDDPLFWQKVMPNFVTPNIMLTKLNDLCNFPDKRQNVAENGEPSNGGGPGRPGRKKKLSFKAAEVATDEKEKVTTDQEANDDEVTENKDVSSPSTPSKTTQKDKQQQSNRSIVKKTKEFMSDLASMMERVLEEEEDGTLPQSDKATCQKLLLTVSVKENFFSEEQRIIAKVLLRRLEGDRKRRCRTAKDGFDTSRSKSKKKERKSSTNNGNDSLISDQGRPKKRGRKPKNWVEEEDQVEKESLKNPEEDDGDDGFLQHGDSEDDWSGGEDDYKVTKVKRRISRKEARRRRAWACDKDIAAAAGRTWPVIPRNVVAQVLGTMLDEVIKNDNAKGGLFSVPVPPDVFPEYYELVHDPMDYGTMKAKLARGEYRSAQGMQKDFILVMQNCLQFNALDSDIVKEARRQALIMPGLLRNASMKHNLFISEDGNVFEIHSDDENEGDNNDGSGGADTKGDHGKKKQPNSVKKAKKERKKRTTGEGSTVKMRRSGMVRSSSPVKVIRCKECVGCKREDCGSCLACMDKPKFGGNGSLKQGCYARQCINMKVAPDSDNSHDGKEQDKDADDSSSEIHEAEAESVSSSSAKKPRIRISLSLNGSTPAGKRKKKSNLDSDKTPVTKVRKRTSKKRPRIAQDNVVNNPKQQTAVDSNGDELGNAVPSIPKKRKKEPSISSTNTSVDKNTTEPNSSIKKKKVKLRITANDDSMKVGSSVETAEDKVNCDKKEDVLPSSTIIHKIPKKSDESSKDIKSDNNGGDTSDSDESGLIDESNISKTPSPCQGEVSEDDSSLNLCMDLDTLKNERLELDANFESCRHHFTKNGPWKLPKSVVEAKSNDVLRHTLNKMCRHDTYKLFAEKVSDDEAPGYSAVVTNPMDFSTMRTKLTQKTYGTGSEALSLIYHDFLLIMDNCGLYNEKDSDVGKEAGRLLSLLPEVFAAACLAVGDKKRRKKKTI